MREGRNLYLGVVTRERITARFDVTVRIAALWPLPVEAGLSGKTRIADNV
jgi:hypothetical protein